jgi:hypothetical protein
VAGLHALRKCGLRKVSQAAASDFIHSGNEDAVAWKGGGVMQGSTPGDHVMLLVDYLS